MIDDKREARIRALAARGKEDWVDVPFLLRRLDEARSETARLRSAIRQFTHEMLTSNDLGELAQSIKLALETDNNAAKDR